VVAKIVRSLRSGRPIVLFSAGGTALVERSPLGALRPWPFDVSCESGKWRVAASAVSPGQDAKCLFLIAFSQVGFVGNPAAAW